MAAHRDSPPDALARYAKRTRELSVAPLWEFFRDWFGPQPAAAAVPHIWRYETIRPLLCEAAKLITAAEAERRVLALENPGLAGQRLATDALYAGLQLIEPGEIAPSHRHSAAALRFVIEGSGAYTAVGGERAYMAPGDFIVTPSWAWHEHGNESAGSTVWLDVLDVALVRFLGAGFSEHYPGGRFPERAPPGDSRFRYGANMRPAGYARPHGGSPVFSYPYAPAREALERLQRNGPLDPCHGVKMEYVDPTTGAPAIPTLSTFLQLVPAGMRTFDYRSTAGAVYAVVEGTGHATVGAGEQSCELRYGPHDVFAVPGWQPLVLEPTSDSVLFSASNEAAQRLLGIWRERRGGDLV